MSPRRLTCVLGVNQLLSWATSYYLPATVAGAAATALGASPTAIIGGFSWALLVAGVSAPAIGRHIDRAGGRRVLAAGSLMLAAGLATLAAAATLQLWYLGWTVMGFGMALGLYEAAFATVGRQFGTAATPVIAGITLFAGFASTASWPASAFLIAHIGWRPTLLAFAALQLAINLPLSLWGIPGQPPPAIARNAADAAMPRQRLQAVGIGGFFATRWFLSSALAVFALPLLHRGGLSEPQAVLAASLIGPGQVVGRLLELALGSRVGVLWRARLGALLMPLGTLLLLAGGPLAGLTFAIAYGMSNGILTINRGTLPLALFGPAGYAALLGRLALPVLLAQAAAPTLVAPIVTALPFRQIVALIALVATLAMAPLWAIRITPPAGSRPGA